MSGLRLFGSPAFDEAAGGRRLVPSRPTQLLAYLACRGAWVSRDVAATLLWPERTTSTARANLRFVLVQIKRLEHIDGLEARADALRWNIDCDVRRFERAVDERRWADAIAEYGGPLLEGFEADAPAPYVEWLQFERARLQALWHDAVAQRLAQLGDDPAGCAALATRALHADPLDETALSFQVRALQALGRAEDARRAYRDYAQRLAAELGIEPSAELRNLVRRLDPQHTTTRAASVGADRAPVTGAPTLVDRRLELARISQRLRSDDCRLLTITGPGGVGKSALARAALPQLAADFADGAHWIALDDLKTIEQVSPRVAAVLGVELRGIQSPERQLIEHLGHSRTLLAFDNAEHLPGFGDWLATVLSDCDRLKALVTSRARLEMAPEHLLPLEGLPVPEAEETEPELLRTFDAVHLFELRAARVHPDFDGQANATEVAALVRIVGGLPLAIELAAAWVRLLPVAEIRHDLSTSLDLLDGDGAHDDRSHSVRASFEHSWRLLAPAEQRALMRLSSFHGDFSRESARAVADVSLPLLAALVDKSTLRAEASGRFSFHPLIRQLAHEKLVQAGADEERSASVRHGEHFLALLARFNDFESADQRAALEQIGAEFNDVAVAWQWAIGARRIDLLQRCAGALEGYLDARGEHLRGQHLFDLAAQAIDASAPAHQLARCQVELGRAAFRYRRGEFAEGERAARSALDAAIYARYRFGIKSAGNTLGLILWRLGRMTEAAHCIRSALRRTRAEGDEAGIAIYAQNLGAVEREIGNYDEAERLITEAVDLCRRQGSLSGIEGALNELAILHLDRGRPAAVLPLAHEGLSLCESTGFTRATPYFHQRLADAHFELGDDRLAAEHARLALDAIQSSGDRALEPGLHVRLASIELRAGRFASALAELQSAARLGLEMRSPRVQLAVLLGYGRYEMQRRRADSARELFSIVASHPAAVRRQRDKARAELAAMPGATGPADTVDLAQALDRLLTEPH